MRVSKTPAVLQEMQQSQMCHRADEAFPKTLCKALVSVRSLGGKWYFCAKHCVLTGVQSWCAVLNCHL